MAQSARKRTDGAGTGTAREACGGVARACACLVCVPTFFVLLTLADYAGVLTSATSSPTLALCAVVGLFVGIAACGACLAARGGGEPVAGAAGAGRGTAGRGRRDRARRGWPRLAAGWAGAGLVALGVCVLTLGSRGLAVPGPAGAFPAAMVVGALAGALTGAGIAQLVVTSGGAMAGIGTLHDILACSSLALGVSALLEWVFMLVQPAAPTRALVAACLLACLVASVGVALVSRHGARVAPRPEAVRDDRPRGAGGVVALFREYWVLLCGLALPLMICGFGWGGTVRPDAIEAGSASVLERPLFMGVALLVTFFALRRSGPVRASLLFQVLPLAAASLLAAMWIMPTGVSLATSVTMSVTRGLAFAVFSLGTWVYLCTSVAERGIPAARVMGAFVAAGAALTLACVALGALLPQPVTAVVTPCLTIAYLLVVAVVEIVQGSAQQPVAWDSGIGRACGKLSAERGLTPRESEVLVYLAKGRTATFIADELKISPNTAQTHIKRIHEKLGVSSKDEIIGMVESRI